jgi:colanic acid/amylovoran biosynthesis glycosyltransferase
MLVKRFILTPLYTLRILRYLLKDKQGFSYPNCFFALTVIRKKYDILLCHFGFNGNKGLLLKRIDPRLKLVTMFHGCDLRLGLEKGAGFYAELFSEGDLILANSQYMYNELIGLGANPAKMKVHYPAFDFDKFAGQQKAGKTADDSLVILSVARLVEEKGLEFGLRAFKILLDINPAKKLKYIIVGGGYLEPELKKLAKDMTIEESVFFAGPVTSDEVVDYMTKADIFFLPSIKEAFPVVLLEAQAFGLPSVASDIAGVAEIILDGKSGFLVKSADYCDMADKLNRLVNNPQLREQMALAGRPHVREKNAAAVLSPKLEKLLSDLLA